MTSVVVVSCPVARASGPLVWSHPKSRGTGPLLGLACPSTALCVGVNRSGDVLSSTNPFGRSPAWRIAHVDVGNSVSCPSAALCVAVGADGSVASSTHPTEGASAWTVGVVDDDSAQRIALEGVSCPSVALCVAVDSVGDAVTSTDPSAGSATWTVTHVDNYECYHYMGGPSCQQELTGVACPSTSLCAAVDFSGNVLETTNPPSWSPSPAGTSGTNHFYTVACPSRKLCATVDGYNGDVITWDPASPSNLTYTSLAPASLFDIWCGSTVCLAAGGTPSGANGLWASANPGGPHSWSLSQTDPAGITSAACPSPAVCITGDSTGHVLLATAIAPLRTALAQLAPNGRRARIHALLKNRGYPSSFNAPTSGSLVIQWYLPAPRRARGRQKGKALLVATAKTHFGRPGKAKLKVNLTGEGRTLLIEAKHLKLRAKSAFTPAGASSIAYERTLVLNS
jgi:hypothetical protein